MPARRQGGRVPGQDTEAGCSQKVNNKRKQWLQFAFYSL